MRKNLFLVLALFTAFSLNVNAEVTVGQITEPEYLINNGYSEIVAEEVFIVKNRCAAKPTEPLYDKYDNKIIKAIRKFYEYVDPCMDNDEKYHHDIHMSPNYKDL